MKHFLPPSLRLAPAALALGLALAFAPPPATADTLFYGGDNPYRIETGSDTEWTFEIIRNDTSAAATVTATSSSGSIVRIRRASATGNGGTSASVTLYKEPQTNPDRATDVAEFVLVPIAPGDATITVSMAGAADISFDVVVTGSDTERQIRFFDVNNNPITAFASLGEGDTRTILYQPAVALEAAPSSADWADHVEFSVNPGVLTLKGIDGTYSCGLGLSDPANALDATSLNILVTNKPPKISGSPDSKEPTILGGRRLKNQIYAFPASMFTPSDVAADMEKLTFTWSLSSASIGIDGAFSNAWSSATEEGEYELFSVTVSDGNDSYTGYYALQIKDTVPLFTDTTAPWAGLEKRGGIAQFTTFTAMDSAGNPLAWTLLGGKIGRTLVGPGESVTLSAILEDGTYPFGWFGNTDEHLRAPNATRTPSPNTWAIVSIPEEGDVTVNYFASYPYYHTVFGKGATDGLNPVLTDLFGDFDADGLSDTWEDYYFPAEGVAKTSDNVESLPVGIPTGDYGPTGNRDEDWLPTSLYEPAPDEEDPPIGKIGWPAEDPDNPGVTNRYRVYKYPLDFSTGGESYNKSAYDEKPLYGNFVEYRGLAEDRTGGPGNVDSLFVYYVPEILDSNDTYGPRGNASGTDPENYDTDADGFSDGWEFYFWTTIKYRVNPQNWRAWDPTYSLYNTASASAGIPLLRTDEPVDFTFTIDPTESYVIDPAAGTHRTTYEVDKDVVKANNLIMPVKPGSVRIVFDNAEGFTLWTIPGRMTSDGRDALFYQQWGDLDYDGVPETPAVDDNGDPIPAQLDGAWVDGTSGFMHIPGWTVLSALSDTGAAADIDQDTTATISYVRLNGIFTQKHLLSRFDPMNWTQTDMGGMAVMVKGLGLDEKKWDPDSDLDGDGLLDIEEYYLGTDPLHWDTDRDGMPDGWEVQRGLLPRDPRNEVNGCGPGDNPDEDYMAVSTGVLGEAMVGRWTHIYSYLADLNNRRYWNGLSYVGFVPGRAATEGDGFSNLEEFLVSLYGFQTGFWFDEWRLPLGYGSVYGDRFYKGIYPIDWPQTTSNPCDNDTNQNGIPDGWELYVGWNPVDGVCVTPLAPPPEGDQDGDLLNLRQEFACVEAAERWAETRTVYIGADATITQNTSTTVDADGNTNTVYSTTGEGTEVTIRALPLAMPAWTNKKLPTDPWNADTDGDGLSDYQEYTDEMDGNGDGIELTNFNPGTADTDLDWLPDGWEFLMGTYTTNQTQGVSTTDPYGPFGDPDGDGLPNYQEYLTGANYAWRHDHWYDLDNQKIWIPQKRPELGDLDDKYDILQGDWPYDPGLYPEYGPVVRAHQYQPMDFFAVPESPEWISEGIIALQTIEKRWGVTDAVDSSPSLHYETVAAFYQRLTEIVKNPFDDPLGVSKFMDDTQPSVDPYYNIDVVDVPGKKYFQYHSPEEHWAIVHAFEGMLAYLYSYAQCPYPWDTAALNNTPSGVPWTYIPLNDNSTAIGFPGTRPKELDSDHDNMPDYWEIYHGLNPIYGGCIAISNKAGSEANTDWDGADNWMMGADPNFVLNLRVTPQGVIPSYRMGLFWEDASHVRHGFGDGRSGPFGLNLERAHYDLVFRPWLAGDPSADADHDGINNSEESYSVFANDLLHNTDPSPYWMTDITQTYGGFGQKASHVNLYYTSLGFGDDPADYWWWEYPYDGNDGCNQPPTYLWDFEINEGYDSDNNNISDREELTDVSTRGKTDPQNLDSPVARKAMYFDGYAACRTQRPFFHDQYALTSFTVELWVRPQELPAPGKIATLLQRPVMMPVDTVSGSKAWDIRHTFLVYLNDKGQICAEVDNDGIEQPANKAVVSSAGRLVPNVWTHVALVMDSQGDRLTLYVNGEQASQIATSLKPCTGVIMDTAYQNWVTSEGGANGVQTVSTTTVNFQYSPAPIVLGAFDTTPWSVVGLNPDATFDRNRFFKGWIDEVRIWDRARSQSEIFNNMTKRFTKADFESINLARFKWDMENLYQTNSEADFPQKLLYLYNFDNLPDVAPAPTRVDALVFASDTDPVPAGWPQIAATRPIPYVPWWYVTKNKSTVYSADYAYVPFIENVVSHLPQRPPRGVKELVPVFTEGWDLAGYRNRLSADWSEELDSEIMAGATVIGDVAYQYEGTGAAALIAPNRLTNSMDPYGDTYSTGVASLYEVSPWNFAGILDPYGVYEGVPIHSDMVPLLDAVADMDVPMWDGKGAGWDNATNDSDGDGMPDWWEIAHGLDPNDASGHHGAYGDADGDGLDNWAEYLAQTDPHAYDTDYDGYSDYYSRPDGQSLTYGELYDDGDGMDNAWEMQFNLNPNRYDANEDADHDGWTNWEEFMAGTNPRSVTSFPLPTLSVTFDYVGASTNMATLTVLSYGRRTAGDAMGGAYDGKFSTAPNIGYGVDRFGRDGIARISGSDFYVNLYPLGHVVDAQLTVGTDDGEAVYPLEHANDEYGMFFNDLTGMAGLVYESGTLFCSPECVGKSFQLNVTIDGYSFPITFDTMLRKANTHLVGGYNRFIGFADRNGNGEYDVGEPMGLSLHRPTLASWDSVGVEIPMTDELWGFPRFSWPASTNDNVTAYTVYIWNSAGKLVVPDSGIKINAPRTFIHEGDLIRSGVNGIPLGQTQADSFSWSAIADNSAEEEILAEGSFQLAVTDNQSQRQALVARYPTQRTVVRGNVVEFEWKMDRRNAGVIFNLWKEDGANETQIVKDMVIPLPVRHGGYEETDGYWSAIPQMENGEKFLALDPGQYRYTIEERPNSSAVTPGVITERFQLENNPTNRSLYTVSGSVRYFGKVMAVDPGPYASAAFAANEDRTVFTATVADPSTIVEGAMSVLVKNGNDAQEVLNDSQADGVLHAAGAEDYIAWTGMIDYETGRVEVRFAEPLPAGRTLALARKTFPAPLVLQAFALPDGATTGTSVSGNPVYQTTQTTKGVFSLPNLVAGTYAVRGFIDSNNDGVAQAWETQGVAVKGGNVSPVISSDAEPIVVNGDVKGLMLVLHDRDTDNDLLPDAWEYWKNSNLQKSGYDLTGAGGLYWWQEYADGILDSDPRTPDTDLDGLTDAMEILVTGTDTHLADTDGDGIGDLEEFLAGSDPLDPAAKSRYAIPALAFDADGVPYVDIAYPALRPGVVLTYELQRKLSLGGDEAWETVAEHDVANTDGAVFYAASDGVNDHLSEAGTVRMRPADQAEDVDFTTGFYRVKIYADYGKMVDNGDGTWSYWTWVKTSTTGFEFKEAARGEGTLVRDANGNWRFVDPETKQTSGSLFRDPDGDWKFVQ